LPNAGSPCDVAGLACGRDCDLDIVCDGQVWQWLDGYCPTCAAPATPIATPEGERPIAALRAGDLVYSIDHDAVVAVPVLQTQRARVHGHRVVHVVLDGGVTLDISAGHPTADGRRFGDLASGARLDDRHVVASAVLVPYVGDATYDILPASDTGTYFAGGVAIGSTLFRATETR
jgi:hypothetical protein